MKKLFLLVFLVLMLFNSKASPVDPESAGRVGLNFWKCQATGMKDIDVDKASIFKTYTFSENGEAVYYVFDVFPKGFVIVAADDAVIPILGYSFEGYYKPDDQPEAYSEWMHNYAMQITDARAKDLSADQEAGQAWEYYNNVNTDELPKTGVKGVYPLITTRRDQGSGYNDDCPEHSAGPGGRCWAGCVATAMAQVMKFWNHPDQGTGSHSYYHPFYGAISADFGNTTYNWASMTNSSNSSSRAAISLLIFHCGVSVDMYYSPLGSSSYTALVKDALKDYFNYRLTVRLIDKTSYTWYDWRSILMDNLDDGKPIVYSGSGGAGGHAWVCDGYQDTTHFHMNWGWSGWNNGYYALTNLNSGNGDFSSGQEAVVDIIPYFAPYCVPHKIMKDKMRSFGDGSQYSYYWNNTQCDWLIMPDNATRIVLDFTSFKTESGKDIVSIYDGSTTAAPLLGVFSGHDLPPLLTSSGGSMLIVFTSDDVNQDLGWEATYIATVTGTDEYDMNAHLAIYPNPASGLLNLYFDQPYPEKLKYEIFNITGQLLISGNIEKNAGDFQIGLSGLTPGLYMLAVSGEKSRQCYKIAVK